MLHRLLVLAGDRLPPSPPPPPPPPPRPRGAAPPPPPRAPSAPRLHATGPHGARLRRTARASGRQALEITAPAPPPVAAGVFPVQGAYTLGSEEARFGA